MDGRTGQNPIKCHSSGVAIYRARHPGNTGDVVSQTRKSTPKTISNRFIKTVCARLNENKRVRRTLPQWGRVHIDRQLPFLVVYRRPPNHTDPGTERLVLGEASYPHLEHAATFGEARVKYYPGYQRDYQ